MYKVDNRICVSLGNISFQECLVAVKKYPLCEVRLDLSDFSLAEIDVIFKSGNKLVATSRPGKHSHEKRKEMLLAAVRLGASYVDIEFQSPYQFQQDIIVEAQKKHCQTIISYHNFEYTPAKNYLEQIAQSCFDRGADIAKVVCLVKEENDLSKLYKLYGCFNKLIAFGMGDMGKESRIKSLELGAEFSYAALAPNKETAPGQMCFDEMKSKILEYFNPSK
ncbi:MAG: type I 3-dehydroquinate dehydratase [Bacteroidales bacterium]|nr:type I 3-dehydroquinate dehydratase [Bacteroidales bacterium]MCF8455318.1 type I 3-dehydroquinate dehydratase [Bacteroidales bacterium]